MNLKNLRACIMIFSIGSVYFLIEGLFRGFQNWPSLIAEVSIWMLLLGGFSGYVMGQINNQNFIRLNFNAFAQSVLASFVITSFEFIVGNILSLFGIVIWGYSRLQYDWLAQVSGGHISFTFMFFWFLIAPFGYWLYDALTFLFFGEGKLYSLFLPYKQLFQFWKKPNIQEAF